MADCAPFGIYGFQNVALTIDGARIIGFAEGDDAIMIEPTTELGTPIVGADGTSIVSITADQSASLTLKLLPNSPFNAYLSQKAKRARGGALTGITFAIGFVDMSNGETGGCTQAVVTKEPSIQRGANAAEKEWRIFCPCWQPGEIQVARG